MRWEKIVYLWHSILPILSNRDCANVWRVTLVSQGYWHMKCVPVYDSLCACVHVTSSFIWTVLTCISNTYVVDLCLFFMQIVLMQSMLMWRCCWWKFVIWNAKYVHYFGWHLVTHVNFLFLSGRCYYTVEVHIASILPSTIWQFICLIHDKWVPAVKLLADKNDTKVVAQILIHTYPIFT